MYLFIGKFIDGGLVFTITSLVTLLAIVILLFYAIKQGKEVIQHMSALGWFALLWGMLGFATGLIVIFDSVGAVSGITPRIIAPGMKMALINLIFGVFNCLVARAGVLCLYILNRKSLK